MLTKNKTSLNMENVFYFNNSKNARAYGSGKLQLKFERNPRIRYRDSCDTDGWTTDEFRFHELY